jgi:hypothetical protein
VQLSSKHSKGFLLTISTAFSRRLICAEKMTTRRTKGPGSFIDVEWDEDANDFQDFLHIKGIPETAWNEDEWTFDCVELLEYFIAMFIHSRLRSQKSKRALEVICKLYAVCYSRVFCYYKTLTCRLETLGRVLELLGLKRDGFEIAQKGEYCRSFEELIPDQLLNCESVWQYVFEYHYSAEKDTVEMHTSACELLAHLVSFDDMTQVSMFSTHSYSPNHHVFPFATEFGATLRTITDVMINCSDNIVVVTWGILFVINLLNLHGREARGRGPLITLAFETIFQSTKHHMHHRHFVLFFLATLSLDRRIFKFKTERWSDPYFSPGMVMLKMLKLHSNDIVVRKRTLRTMKTMVKLEFELNMVEKVMAACDDIALKRQLDLLDLETTSGY